MARIRSVHPELCRDDVLADVSAEAERTFIRLWPHLDDAGRAKDSPRLLKADLYPLHDHVSAEDVNRDLDELAAKGLVLRYEVDGKRYLTAKPEAWATYQKPRHPSPSKLPAPSAGVVRPPSDVGRPPEEDTTAPADGGSPTAQRRNPPAGVVVGEGVGEGEGEPPVAPDRAAGLALVPSSASPPATGDAICTVFDAWVASVGRTTRTVLSPERRRLIIKQLKDYPVEDLVDAVRGWRHSAHHRGENDRSTVYNDLELLLRDAKHIEMFRDLERDPPGRPVPKGMKGIAAWLERTGTDR